MAQQGTSQGTAYARKARSELDELEARGVQTVGNAFASVLLVKGVPGEAELAGGAPLSGKDGNALRAALLALGYAPEDWAGIAAWDERGNGIEESLMRQAVVTLDPATLVMCDDRAVESVRNAFADDLVMLEDFMDASIAPGRVVKAAGMRMLNLDGFEDALVSEREKQLRWAWLKQIPPLGEPY